MPYLLPPTPSPLPMPQPLPIPNPSPLPVPQHPPHPQPLPIPYPSPLPPPPAHPQPLPFPYLLPPTCAPTPTHPQPLPTPSPCPSTALWCLGERAGLEVSGGDGAKALSGGIGARRGHAPHVRTCCCPSAHPASRAGPITLTPLPSPSPSLPAAPITLTPHPAYRLPPPSPLTQPTGCPHHPHPPPSLLAALNLTPLPSPLTQPTGWPITPHSSSGPITLILTPHPSPLTFTHHPPQHRRGEMGGSMGAEGVLSSQVPCLMGYLSDPVLSDAVLGVLVDVSQASPSSLAPFLPRLRGVGQQHAGLLGHIAKIHGAVGMTSEIHSLTAWSEQRTTLSCPVPHYTLLPRTALHSPAPYRTTLSCPVPHYTLRTTLSCPVPHYTLQPRTALHSPAPYRTTLSALHSPVTYRTTLSTLHSPVPYRTTLSCPVPHYTLCTTLSCPVTHYTLQSRTALHSPVPYRTTLSSPVPHYTLLPRTALHSPAPYRTTLSCPVPHYTLCTTLSSPEEARSSLLYLVSLLSSMEHSVHHTLLLEIRRLTERYGSLLGGGAKDIYRMSNSFTAIARLLTRRLEAATACRSEEAEDPCKPAEADSGGSVGDEDQHLQVKIQAFEEKMVEEGGDTQEDENSPAPQRRYSLGQSARDERREMRFNRSKSLALHAVRSRSINSDNGQEDGVELTSESLLCESPPSPPDTPRTPDGTALTPSSTPPAPPITSTMEVTPKLCPHGQEEETGDTDERGQKDAAVDKPQDADRLWMHMRDNLEAIKAFCTDMVRQIPVPDHCVIEGN
ncbi:hypothetical protein ACEWY4_008649 [Coilia grayii]|uniref:Uncharacterized protein n=1 Tax=Coilia grayii TaxID=363190 RepID=A0ABD1KBR8_9TELE